jgi:hypothetical protein
MRLNGLLRNLMAGVLMLGLAGVITRAPAGDCTIQFDSLLQHMTGFGGSTAGFYTFGEMVVLKN